jgi:hypothetical protein
VVFLFYGSSSRVGSTRGDFRIIFCLILNKIIIPIFNKLNIEEVFLLGRYQNY